MLREWEFWRSIVMMIAVMKGMVQTTMMMMMMIFGESQRLMAVVTDIVMT